MAPQSKVKSTRSTITPRHDTYEFISPSKHVGKLRGKVVLVTGAGRGIGKHISEAFAAAGASVACMARTESDIKTLATYLHSKYSVPTLAITGDVVNDPIDVVKQVETELGAVDILINNAGISRFSDLEHEDEDIAQWWRVMEVNVKGPIGLTRAVLPSMLRKGKGFVITTTSGAATLKAPYFSAYCASKAAVTKAVDILNLELRQKGIYSFAVHPGGVDTRDGGDASINKSAMEAVPKMKRIWNSIPQYMEDSPRLVADTMVALVVEDGAKLASGMFIDCTQDLEEVLARLDEIQKEGLYTLQLSKL